MKINQATASPGRPLTPGEIDSFAQDGVVCLKGIIPLPLVDSLREGIDKVFAGFSNMPGNLDLQSLMETANLKKTGRALLSTGVWRENEVVRDFAFNSPVPEIAAGLMRSKAIRSWLPRLGQVLRCQYFCIARPARRHRGRQAAAD